jgi:hypothetical protein
LLNKRRGKGKKTEFYGSISFEMSCQRRIEKISWTDRVRSEVLKRVKKETNILHTVKRRKANSIGHILRRNCLLKHIIEGKIERRKEVKGRQGRRSKQLLDNLEEKRWYCKLREEALDHTLRRHRFGGGYGPDVRKTREL